MKFGNYGLNFTSGFRKTRKATGVEYTRLFNTSLAVVAIGVCVVKQGAELGARADTKSLAPSESHRERTELGARADKTQRASDSEPPIAGS